MPVTVEQAKDAAEQIGLNGNGAQVQNAIQSHIGPKHQDRAHLENWLQFNPQQAAMQQEGYGIRSYFSDPLGKV